MGIRAIHRAARLWHAAESSARALALQVLPFEALRPGDFDRVFAAVDAQRADGLLFIADPIFFINLKRMAELVAARRLPSVSNFTEFPRVGGLIGYAPSLQDEFRRAAIYIDKILKGAKGGDLPVQQPTKFDLVVNIKSAKALGLTIPQSILQRADQVIE